MKIQYASDLHLEFSQNRDYLKANPIEPVGDILVLAGDIVLFSEMHKHDWFFQYVSDNFNKTYWVAGNHEYYNFDISKRSGSFCESITSNVFLINNTAVIEKDVKLIFSTLWTEISVANQFSIENSLNDFHVITNNGNRFKPTDYNNRYKESVTYITKELQTKNADKQIVITHHVPTFMNYPEKYRGDILNEAFAVELFDLIATEHPHAWIYGHTHSNTADFLIDNTKLLCNQLGYVKYNEHSTFNNSKIIEI